MDHNMPCQYGDFPKEGCNCWKPSVCMTREVGIPGTPNLITPRNKIYGLGVREFIGCISFRICRIQGL